MHSNVTDSYHNDFMDFFSCKGWNGWRTCKAEWRVPVKPILPKITIGRGILLRKTDLCAISDQVLLAEEGGIFVK